MAGIDWQMESFTVTFSESYASGLLLLATSEDENYTTVVLSGEDANFFTTWSGYLILDGTKFPVFADGPTGANPEPAFVDFDLPLDSNGDNVYQVDVQMVRDDRSTDVRTFSFFLTNIPLPAIVDADHINPVTPQGFSDHEDINTSYKGEVTAGAANGTRVGIAAFTSDALTSEQSPTAVYYGWGASEVTYSLLDDAGGRFQISPSTGGTYGSHTRSDGGSNDFARFFSDTNSIYGTDVGVVTVKDGVNIAYDPNGTNIYSITVQAFDGREARTKTFDIKVFPKTTATADHDLNGDGKADILFSHQGGVYASNYEWQIDDRALAAQGAIDLYDKSFIVQVTGDFNGDGRGDLLFQNSTTGGVWQWRLDGTKILSQGAVDVGDPTYHLLGTADFNGDFKDDVLFRNDVGFVYLWQMDGFDNTPLPVQALDPTWHVQGAGDFDGDGKSDILLRNIGGDPNENGAFFLWQMDGANIVGQGGIERPGTDWKTLGIGDFDGDGKDDFAVRNVSVGGDNGAVWVYLMNGTAIKAQGAAGIADAATWHLQQIGDLNGDGKDDILYRNDAGYFYSWDMDGTHIASEGLLQGAAQHADPSFHVVAPHWDLV